MQRAAALRPTTVRLLAAALALLLLALLPADGRAQSSQLSCLLPVTPQKDPRGAAPLNFGIYPGGVAGSVSDKAEPLPEVPQTRLRRLQELRGSRGLSVHLYTDFSGDPRRQDGGLIYLEQEIRTYAEVGIDVELVVRYRPAAGRDVDGYAAYLRGVVQRLGRNKALTSLQVTNEANLGGQQAASDGAYDGAVDALVEGVIAAKDAVRSTGFAQVKVGFNWASDTRRAQSNDFFTAIGRRGGAAFSSAVDWVGVDSYPGTFFPEIALTALVPNLTGLGVTEALRNTRFCLMPLAGLGADIPIHVSENGFPTGAGRSYAMQASILDAMVRAVDDARATFNVAAYNWFDLRDSRTADDNVESQYGITQDDYTPKPAFATYRDLIGRLAVPGHAPAVAAPVAAATPGVTCAKSPVKIALPTLRGWTLKRLRITRADRTVKSLGRRSRVPRSVTVKLAPGRARLTIRISGARAGKARTHRLRRTVTVCGATR